ncbi:MAG: sigma-70 family RNA polymerase sigma factor, partial [Lachnospiraceae bacterium]|nr:sigma-70 family RNA polymerase sigma factor [Candidatus Equihabitans merdae]
YVRSLAHARFLVGGETDDLIQEGMIGLMKAIRDYRSDKGASFKTFATMCIVRQQTTAIENASRQKNRPLNDSVLLSGEELETALFYMRHSSPEDILLDKESEKELAKRITEVLSSFEKQVLLLYLEDKGYREIAEELEKSPKTIDNALQRIRNKVRALEQ